MSVRLSSNVKNEFLHLVHLFCSLFIYFVLFVTLVSRLVSSLFIVKPSFCYTVLPCAHTRAYWSADERVRVYVPIFGQFFEMMNRCSLTNYIYRESEKYFYSGENRTHDLDVASVKVEVVSLISPRLKYFSLFWLRRIHLRARKHVYNLKSIQHRVKDNKIIMPRLVTQ